MWGKAVRDLTVLLSTTCYRRAHPLLGIEVPAGFDP